MASVHLLGELCSGHGNHPARASTSGSPNVKVNGLAVHRVGDSWAIHCQPGSSPDCHAGELSGGSASVKVNSFSMARVGDPIDCGSTVAGAGSPTVSCGD